MIKCNVWYTLLYGIEAWTLKEDTIKILEALELLFRKRMLRAL